MNINLYFDLKTLSVNDVLIISNKQLANKVGISISQVKLRLKELILSGYIKIEHNKAKNGGDASNKIILLRDSIDIKDRTLQLPEIREIIDCYHSFVENRIKKTMDKRILSKLHTKDFYQILNICNEYCFNKRIYIASCFHTFNEKWCNKNLGRPYPHLSLLTSKKNANERYEGFLRFQMSNKLEIFDGDEFKNEVLTNYHKWHSMGEPKDEITLIMLMDNEILSQFFVSVITGITPDKYPIDITNLEKAKQIMREINDI